MCIYSAIGDYYDKNFQDNWPDIYRTVTQDSDAVTKADLEKLATKEDIARIEKTLVSIRELLKAAIKFDDETDQAHCENEDKVALLRKLGDVLGVDMRDIDPDRKD